MQAMPSGRVLPLPLAISGTRGRSTTSKKKIARVPSVQFLDIRRVEKPLQLEQELLIKSGADRDRDEGEGCQDAC